MSKAKIIAISAMCAAVALGCMMLSTLPVMRWVMLMLGVVASIAVVIPIMLDAKNLVYTLLTYVTCGALGVFFGLANIVFVAPIVVFSIPFAIVKVYGETFKVTEVTKQEQTLEDPFGNGDDRKVISVNVNAKRRLPAAVKWVLYYVLLEVAIGLTLLAAYLLTPDMFHAITSSKWFWWVVVGMQVIVYPYDILMRGCLLGTAKILRKVVKPQ